MVRNRFMAILGVGLAVTAANARTINIDDDAPNDPGPGDPTISDPDEDGTPEHPFDCIQEGIDAANHFDTVLVADGTYTGEGNKNLDFGGKFITVRSENGPESSVIDCEDSGRGFYFHYGESQLSVVDGFTITNGSAGDGGAIRCDASAPTIANCTMTGNAATGNGGAVGCYYVSRPTIINCTIVGNTAGDNGAGVSCAYDSSPVITNCRIADNTASDNGGGVWCYDHSSPTISWSSIEGNTADEGGGVYCEQVSSPTISNCSIERNRAQNDAGGLYSRSSSHPSVANSTIAGNSAAHRGGGMFCYEFGRATITNCTIAGNMASRDGGGICAKDGANVTMCNCILWANSAPNGGQIAILAYGSGSTVSVSYSDVQGGPAAIPVGRYCTLNWGPGNIDANPFFANPGAGDYRLWAGSPCIDAADNGAVPPDIADVDGDGDTTERTPLDLGGNLRFVDDCETPDTGMGTPPIVDMGAYEYQPSDVDADGDLDLLDFAGFQLCFTGSDSGPVGPGSEGFDADCDEDVDLADFAAFQAAFMGP